MVNWGPEDPADSDVVRLEGPPGGRLVVADDNSNNLALLEMGLGAFGFVVLTAKDGKAALELTRRELPDAVLLDVHMPLLDGFEVCRQLKAGAETAHIPVLFVTALAVDFNRGRGFEVGAADYITKPLDLDVLRARLQAQVSCVRLRRIVREQHAALQKLQLANEELEAALAASRAAGTVTK